MATNRHCAHYAEPGHFVRGRCKPEVIQTCPIRRPFILRRAGHVLGQLSRQRLLGTDSVVVRMGVFWSEEVAMRRTHFFIFVVFGMATATFAQTTSSDSQTLQALLTEVRQLRQDLQASLTRMQSAQILLSRLQIQEVAVSRASQHLDDARSKLAEVEVAVKSEQAEIKHFEVESLFWPAALLARVNVNSKGRNRLRHFIDSSICDQL